VWRRWWFWPALFAAIVLTVIAVEVMNVKIKKFYMPQAYFLYKKHDIYAGSSGFNHAERIAKSLHKVYSDKIVLIIYKTMYPGTPFDTGEYKIFAGVILSRKPKHIKHGWRLILWPTQKAYWVIHNMNGYTPHDLFEISKMAINLHGIRAPYWEIVGERQDGKIANIVLTKCPTASFCTLRTWHCDKICRNLALRNVPVKHGCLQAPDPFRILESTVINLVRSK